VTVIFVFAVLAATLILFVNWKDITPVDRVPIYSAHVLERCRSLKLTPGVESGFASRQESDRYVPGTPRVLLKNATIWTGNDNGREILYQTDVLLERGLIKSIGKLDASIIEQQSNVKLNVVQLNGAWLTPGYERATIANISLIRIRAIHLELLICIPICPMNLLLI